VKTRASVPIGTSTGKYEAKYLPTEDAVRKFMLIRRHFATEPLDSQEDVDTLIHIIDKTSDFREMGGNLTLAISSACLKALAAEENMEVWEYLANTHKITPHLPRPVSNVCGGWNKISDIQEFLLLPVHQESFADIASRIAEAYLEFGHVLNKEDPTFAWAKNLESGWVTNLRTEEILHFLTQIANKNMLKIGMDVAASHLWNGNNYVYPNANHILSTFQQKDYLEDLMRHFPAIHYIEDPFHEEDFVTSSVLTKEFNQKIIVGDDLFATSVGRLKNGISFQATNSVLVKPNQVGTITDTINFVKLAKENHLKTVFSHRSGETEDVLLCHLAAGLASDFIKLGIAGERVVKINEMIRIEEKMKEE
jgi:enolase